MKRPNELCTDEELIHNLDECKSAIRYLKNLGSDIAFVETESSMIDPKGCYKYTNSESYWNTHPSGAANKYAEVICRKG